MNRLAVIAGNTNIRAGIFRDDKLEKTFILNKQARIETECEKAYIISSNDKHLNEAINIFKMNGLEYEILKKRNCINTEYKLDEMGIDRFIAVYHAQNEGKFPHLIIDTGTADTYEFIDETGLHTGGYINAGLSTMYRALNEYTDALPLCEPSLSERMPGTRTENALSSGIYLQWISGILGMIELARGSMSAPYITICGGNADRLQDYARDIRIDAHYVIKGVYRYAKDFYMQG